MVTEKIAELLHQYFELGVAEGKEGRNHDTEAGDAQRVLSELGSAIAALSTDAEPVKPYGYVVELRTTRVQHQNAIARSRVQPYLQVADACAEHWKTIYAVDGADIGRCIRKLSTENPIKWAEAEKKPILRGWFVGQVMKHFDGKLDEKIVRELVDIVFAVYPAAPAAKLEEKS